MKIINFGVNNFRWINWWIENNSINFDWSNTLFIFWQNNAGKSSFLRAYEYFYNNTIPVVDDFYLKNPDNKIEFVFEFELDVDDLTIIEARDPSKMVNFRTKYLSAENKVVLRKVWAKEGTKFKDDNFTFNWTTSVVDNIWYWWFWLHNVFQSCLPKPIFISALPTKKETEDIINSILEEKAKSVLENSELQEYQELTWKLASLQEKMYDSLVISSYKEEVNVHFCKAFSDIKIELTEKDQVKYTTKSFWKNFEIEFQSINWWEINSNIPTNWDKIWHWAIRTAIFNLFLMKDIVEWFERKETRKDYLVLFEEPELFLHPKILRIIRKLVYEVSWDSYPYQILCASHSPQMIDISKPKTSLIRMVKNEQTKLFQINESILEHDFEKTKDEIKDEMNEILRFNPFICESFYADEVILVEWPTEELIIRWYLNINDDSIDKDVFVVNCWTVTNIPFYQKIFSKFNIKYHVICDTDNASSSWVDTFWNTIYSSWIQKSIYEQFYTDKNSSSEKAWKLLLHHTTFEPAHRVESVPERLRMPSGYLDSDWKPFNANRYWKEVLSLNLNDSEIDRVPIIYNIKQIIN
ncbi:MAG: hypothetical protein ACD_3C00086G0038 [uncultured bacterium (gcode 4)]|uniref:Uncharacterized protein n=1 Tax=uncultured bacterium (gcode 4) TaxID=1234023 RepID=K2GDA4_9BACT|nr:MAG: hypothetical protein ACD_3C00086G0038 [uncultured bacterium (gcode 4)]